MRVVVGGGISRGKGQKHVLSDGCDEGRDVWLVDVVECLELVKVDLISDFRRREHTPSRLPMPPCFPPRHRQTALLISSESTPASELLTLLMLTNYPILLLPLSITTLKLMLTRRTSR